MAARCQRKLMTCSEGQFAINLHKLQLLVHNVASTSKNCISFLSKCLHVCLFSTLCAQLTPTEKKNVLPCSWRFIMVSAAVEPFYLHIGDNGFHFMHLDVFNVVVNFTLLQIRTKFLKKIQKYKNGTNANSWFPEKRLK